MVVVTTETKFNLLLLFSEVLKSFPAVCNLKKNNYMITKVCLFNNSSINDFYLYICIRKCRNCDGHQ